jgi:pyruvate formate lyase activating enzyme
LGLLVRNDALDEILPLLDTIFCDLKHLDPASHREYTGAANERMLPNLRKVIASGIRAVIRMPFAPEHDGTHANLHATARFIAEEYGPRVHQLQLLPFRKLGEEKYAALGMRYPMRDLNAPPRDSWEQDLTSAAEIMSGSGVAAVAGAGHRVAA